MKTRRRELHYAAASAPLSDEKRRVLALVTPGTSVLEIGCSDGGFSRHLTEARCHVVGIELDAAAAAAAAFNANRVLVGDVEDERVWQQLDDEFDVVLCMHVLEHLADPWLVLQRATARLRYGGAVLVLLPNVAAWPVRKTLFFRGGFEYEDYGIMDETHLRFFTLTSGRALLERAGLRVVRADAVGTTVPGAGVLRRLPLLRRLAPFYERYSVRQFPNLCGATFLFHGVLQK